MLRSTGKLHLCWYAYAGQSNIGSVYGDVPMYLPERPSVEALFKNYFRVDAKTYPKITQWLDFCYFSFSIIPIMLILDSRVWVCGAGVIKSQRIVIATYLRENHIGTYMINDFKIALWNFLQLMIWTKPKLTRPVQATREHAMQSTMRGLGL